MKDADIDFSDIPEIPLEKFAKAIVRKGLKSVLKKSQHVKPSTFHLLPLSYRSQRQQIRSDRTYRNQRNPKAHRKLGRYNGA